MPCVSSYVGDLFPSFSSVIVFPIIFCLVRTMGEAQLSPISPSTGSEHHDTRLNYDFAVILAAMICAFLCALGLNSMLQCIVRCTRHALTEPIRWIESRQMNAGLKRSDVKTLPITTYAASCSSPATAPAGCAICLVDFSDGEKIRVLPICSHRFHVACIDTWLMSHCSCPTCRHRLFPSHRSEPVVEIVTSP